MVFDKSQGKPSSPQKPGLAKQPRGFVAKDAQRLGARDGDAHSPASRIFGDRVVTLDANGEPRMLNVERDRWHSLVCLEPGSVLFESKDGKYEALREDEISFR